VQAYSKKPHIAVNLTAQPGNTFVPDPISTAEKQAKRYKVTMPVLLESIVGLPVAASATPLYARANFDLVLDPATSNLREP
jgi:hypothetical protein